MNPPLVFKSPNDPPFPLRIADILRRRDQDDDVPLMDASRDAHRGIVCSSPCRIVSRWLSGLRRAKVKREKEDKAAQEEVKETMQTTCSVTGFNGQSRTDVSFNMGIACSILYLIAATKAELNNIMEMRVQIETLLQRTRDELPKNRQSFSSITDAAKSADFDTQIVQESSTVTICDQSFKRETPAKEVPCFNEGMDRLEAELEAELECLQINLDKEKLLKYADEANIKWQVADTDEQGVSSESQTVSSGEIIDLQPQERSTDCGVPPEELERRLHELQEERQQEQIRELEAALECLKHKLHEKEMEVSWWKDTAMLNSKHALEPLQCVSQHDPTITPLGKNQLYDSF